MAARTTPPRQIKACLSWRVASPRRCLIWLNARSTTLRFLSSCASKSTGRPRGSPCLAMADLVSGLGDDGHDAAGSTNRVVGRFINADDGFLVIPSSPPHLVPRAVHGEPVMPLPHGLPRTELRREIPPGQPGRVPVDRTPYRRQLRFDPSPHLVTEHRSPSHDQIIEPEHRTTHALAAGCPHQDPCVVEAVPVPLRRPLTGMAGRMAVIESHPCGGPRDGALR